MIYYCTKSEGGSLKLCDSLNSRASACTAGVLEWYRDRIQKYGMPIEAWEAKTGKKLEEGLYKGTLRRGGHAPGCGCSAGDEILI